MKSYFVDTNYLLRLLLKDDKKQFQEVYGLFQKGLKGKVKLITSVIVFFEVYWVLSSFYKHKKQKCISHLTNILRLDFLEIENKDILKRTLDLFKKHSLDLEDCYNLAFFEKNSLTKLATFDQKMLREIKKI
jgi:predicted nucleic-acid-binding protein